MVHLLIYALEKSDFFISYTTYTMLFIQGEEDATPILEKKIGVLMDTVEY